MSQSGSTRPERRDWAGGSSQRKALLMLTARRDETRRDTCVNHVTTM